MQRCGAPFVPVGRRCSLWRRAFGRSEPPESTRSLSLSLSLSMSLSPSLSLSLSPPSACMRVQIRCIVWRLRHTARKVRSLLRHLRGRRRVRRHQDATSATFARVPPTRKAFRLHTGTPTENLFAKSILCCGVSEPP